MIRFVRKTADEEAAKSAPTETPAPKPAPVQAKLKVVDAGTKDEEPEEVPVEVSEPAPKPKPAKVAKAKAVETAPEPTPEPVAEVPQTEPEPAPEPALALRKAGDQPDPEVGMGATILMHGDRKAATIQKLIKVGSKDGIEVTHDVATRTDSNGESDQQTYTYESDPEGERQIFRRRPDNTWEEVSRNKSTGRYAAKGLAGDRIRIGDRDEFYDYSR
jgi:outer membrane biosynthesis protein TonB